MHVERADGRSRKINLQSFVTAAGKLPSVRRSDERSAKENHLILKELYPGLPFGAARNSGG